jgi:hypothetical protein
MKHGLASGVCGVLAVAGYVLEVAYFGDDETIASGWRIAATSAVALLLLAALFFALVGWRRSVR